MTGTGPCRYLAGKSSADETWRPRSVAAHMVDVRATTASAPASRTAVGRKRYGVLLSHSWRNEVYGDFPTRLLAATEGRVVSRAQPGIEFEVMEATENGWHSVEGLAPEEVTRTRWAP